MGFPLLEGAFSPSRPVPVGGREAAASRFAEEVRHQNRLYSPAGAAHGADSHTSIIMGNLKKKRRLKMNKHKRRKRLKAHRHKKRTWQK